MAEFDNVSNRDVQLGVPKTPRWMGADGVSIFVTTTPSISSVFWARAAGRHVARVSAFLPPLTRIEWRMNT